MKIGAASWYWAFSVLLALFESGSLSVLTKSGYGYTLELAVIMNYPALHAIEL
jgi:hypothetical protein